MENCWYNSAFYFHLQTKKNYMIFDILCRMRIVYTLKRWQTYLQKWFLNACGYFWFIAWWHVKKSSKNFFSSFVCSRNPNPVYHKRISMLSWNSNELQFHHYTNLLLHKLSIIILRTEVIFQSWWKCKSSLLDYKNTQTWMNHIIAFS